MASAAFHFNNQASLLDFAGTSGGTVAATLDSVDGVRTVLWQVASKDETAGTCTFSSTTATSTTITLPSATGKAFLIRCTVNGGTEANPRTGVQQPGDLIKQAKIYIAPEVIAVGETTETDSTNGYTAIVNPVLRVFGNSSGNPTLTAPAGGYASVFESTTEVLRIFDDGGVRSITFQGAAHAEIESQQDIQLRVTGNVEMHDGGVLFFRGGDAANKSFITLPGTAGASIQSSAASQNFEIGVGNGGFIKLQHNSTDAFMVNIASNVSNFDGRGSSGTLVSANSSALTLRGATSVALEEGSANLVTFDTAQVFAGYADMTFGGTHTGAVIRHNILAIRGTSGLSLGSAAPALTSSDFATTFLSASANGVCIGNSTPEADQGGALKLLNATPSGNPSAGSAFLYVDATAKTVTVRWPDGTTTTL